MAVILRPPHADDTIPVRPVSHLLKALGFTFGVGATAFTIAAVTECHRTENPFHFSGFSFDSRTGLPMADFSRFPSTKQKWWEQLTDGDRCALYLVCANLAIFALWKIKKLDKIMWRYFSNSFASKSLCLPMALSVFSHQSFIHLALNMYVVWSFTNVSVNNFLGPNQFWALYLTGGVVSSFVSLAHKAIARSPSRALGASGAILALLGYTCMKIPEARLKIVFVPGFDFSAQSAIISVLLFDLVGMLLRFRLFDHAAHIGGVLFGMYVRAHNSLLHHGNATLLFHCYCDRWKTLLL
ncbi:unnamed protein product [Nippostrongylus brasiliensis]|uniref:rhomboid protease n=1 Tax=Nippostrongylus brasiliensis TaxID=27835 RepID=A0A0N4Y968_NIPBR|nr:unnamed protein product [Nippostrongylus brasiliensis]